MRDPNSYQIGGNHYRSSYEHWDWCIDIRLGYLESASTKYITRWKGKNGVQDVEKGIHYLEKAQSAFRQGRLVNRAATLNTNAALAEMAVIKTMEFVQANNLTDMERDFMLAVADWQDDGDLAVAIGLAQRILRSAVDAAHGQQGAAAPHTPGNPAQATGAAKTGAVGAAGGTPAPAPASSASTELAMKAFGPCPCGCGRPRRKGIEYATDKCKVHHSPFGMEHPFGYPGDD